MIKTPQNFIESYSSIKLKKKKHINCGDVLDSGPL